MYLVETFSFDAITNISKIRNFFTNALIFYKYFKDVRRIFLLKEIVPSIKFGSTNFLKILILMFFRTYLINISATFVNT